MLHERCQNLLKKGCRGCNLLHLVTPTLEPAEGRVGMLPLAFSWEVVIRGYEGYCFHNELRSCQCLKVPWDLVGYIARYGLDVFS